MRKGCDEENTTKGHQRHVAPRPMAIAASGPVLTVAVRCNQTAIDQPPLPGLYAAATSFPSGRRADCRPFGRAGRLCGGLSLCDPQLWPWPTQFVAQGPRQSSHCPAADHGAVAQWPKKCHNWRTGFRGGERRQKMSEKRNSPHELDACRSPVPPVMAPGRPLLCSPQASEVAGVEGPALGWPIRMIQPQRHPSSAHATHTGTMVSPSRMCHRGVWGLSAVGH